MNNKFTVNPTILIVIDVWIIAGLLYFLYNFCAKNMKNFLESILPPPQSFLFEVCTYGGSVFLQI